MKKLLPARQRFIMGGVAVALVTAAFVVMVAGGRMVRAADAAWKVLFNGKPSSIHVVDVNDRESCVPVHFPLEKGEAVYEVRIKTDVDGRTVQVTRTRQALRRVRGQDPCRFCTSSGKCSYCYPQGSGKNTAGQTCAMCNGTGTCNWCGGTGKY